MADPSDSDITAAMRELLPKVDMETTGIKKFTKLLSKEFGGVDFSQRKAFIREALTKLINEGEEEDDEEEEEEESEEESEAEEPPKKRARKSGTAKKGGGGGLSAVKEISEDLANFLGTGRKLARTEVDKKMWDYIKENELQNPSNKREIFLDDKMKDLFGCDSFTMVRSGLSLIDDLISMLHASLISSSSQ